ncbi:MAG TPA: hypothetical protein VE646_12845 [Actinomycetota bacterium]|nr:hypothetical protein [Actinomycetota bacterium]
MIEREERVARNEAISRDINEDLERAQGPLPGDPYARITCECGQAGCERLIAITGSEYERVRSAPERFVVVPDHVDPAVEQVVEQTDRFVVVAKKEGAPREVAEATDPRA